MYENNRKTYMSEQQLKTLKRYHKNFYGWISRAENFLIIFSRIIQLIQQIDLSFRTLTN